MTPTLAIRSCPSSFDSGNDGSPSILDSYRLPTSLEPLSPPTRRMRRIFCRERVDCFVRVTGELKSVDPVSNKQASHCKMSLNSSQNGQQHPVQ